MAGLESVPEGWTVWHEEPRGRVTLAYRTDVFDTGDYPPACLPTLTVKPGASPDQAAIQRERSGRWHVALYLEPAVRVRGVDTAFDDRDDAVAAAVDVAARFATGDVDYRAAYQVPRDAYLAALDDLTGGTIEPGT